MTNYSGCIGVGKVLHVGDTVTSPDGAYVFELRSTGLTISFDGGAPQWPISGLVGVTSAKLTPTSFIIYTSAGPYVIALSIVGVRMCVEDNGQVVVSDVAGDIDPIFSYNNALVLVSASALAVLEASFIDVETKFRVLKQTVRPVSLGVQDENEVRKQKSA
jgi:hypothetical protein